ncbi:MAG: envelope stress response membrane protein PspB [Desulfarculaceae bacterium]|nr:envelope stress response membrane protein PspB [Desulfarculaceae bacterium]
MPAVLAAIFAFVLLVLGILGGVFVAIVRLIKGPKGKETARADQDEARLIQELHQGLTRMESRIDALETILAERQGKEPRS